MMDSMTVTPLHKQGHAGESLPQVLVDPGFPSPTFVNLENVNVSGQKSSSIQYTFIKHLLAVSYSPMCCKRGGVREATWAC